MKKTLKEPPASNDLEPPDTPDGVELVGLENLDPKADDSELQGLAASDPPSDAPGDDAIREQEELYEGLSSDRMPSDKVKAN